MIETINISQLTKDYINNHDVVCKGVHCVYREEVSEMTGNDLLPYIVLNENVPLRYKTLAELKKYIRA